MLTRGPSVRFNRQTLDALTLPPGKAAGFFWDDALKGFGIKLNAGGSKQWVVQYRTPDGKTPRLTIGRVDTVSLDDARRQARIILGKAQTGQDPHAEKAAAKARNAVTVGSTIETYLAKAKDRLKPRSYEEVERHLRRHWQPLHALPLAGIRRADIALNLNRVSETTGRINATRSRAYLSAFFAWCVGEGIAESNPVIGTNKPAEEVSRDRVLTKAELHAVWNACEDDDHSLIVRLLILTAQRRDEVGAMTEAEIDLSTPMWTIPAGRTKNGRAHEIPLSEPALSILRGKHRMAGRSMVFGRGSGGYSAWSQGKTRLDQRIAASGVVVAPWRIHDLRRTAATMMAEYLSIQPHVIEAVLNHVSGSKAGMAGIYNRATYRAEKQDALEQWAFLVTAL